MGEQVDVKEKLYTLEKILKAMEGDDIFGVTAMECTWFQI